MSLHNDLFSLWDNLAMVEKMAVPSEVIGYSRGGRPLELVTLGRGPLQACLVAGAHAEEPAGPALLRLLAALLCDAAHPGHGHLVLPPLAGTWAGRHLLEAFTLHIVPHMNPDGEHRARDAGWLNPMPGPGGFFCELPEAFHRLAQRDLPGDDVEFGWPWSSEELEAPPGAHPVPHIPPTNCPLREENAAVGGRFLEIFGHHRDPQRPLVFHASLHGMAYASGAWCLLGRSWTPHRQPTLPWPSQVTQPAELCAPLEIPFDRSRPLREVVASAVFARGLPLHDMDRQGDKGFSRIGPGFSTAPDVWAMRNHFLRMTPPDSQTAARFRPSSMDFARGLGVDPLVLVSEVPLFLIYGDQAPIRRDHQSLVFEDGGLGALEQLPGDAPGESLLERFRRKLAEVTGTGDSDAIRRCFQDYRVVPVPAAMQVDLVGDMVMAGLACAAAHSDVTP